MKKVSFAGKPTSGKKAAVDIWVENRDAAPKQPTKRLTIDVPIDLHKRIKSHCAMEDLMMADVIRDLLLKQFPSSSNG